MSWVRLPPSASTEYRWIVPVGMLAIGTRVRIDLGVREQHASAVVGHLGRHIGALRKLVSHKGPDAHRPARLFEHEHAAARSGGVSMEGDDVRAVAPPGTSWTNTTGPVFARGLLNAIRRRPWWTSRHNLSQSLSEARSAARRWFHPERQTLPLGLFRIHAMPAAVEIVDQQVTAVERLLNGRRVTSRSPAACRCRPASANPTRSAPAPWPAAGAAGSAGDTAPFIGSGAWNVMMLGVEPAPGSIRISRQRTATSAPEPTRDQTQPRLAVRHLRVDAQRDPLAAAQRPGHVLAVHSHLCVGRVARQEINAPGN